ncbi:YncE family protein [Gramella lutea]|uniref:YncE family protein n=1 Tax=Christiangramia lutea TaxID=1607951 RepID=A0A9X1V504_9FLAO|nr:DUF5074 domain-containing protein [Christiangramia lutea]MCH4822914.1 YncE family protein [Christiangramia lutea]
MKFKHSLLFLLALLFLNSCDDDNDCCLPAGPGDEFETGVFVLNEGNFGSANSSVSYIDELVQVNQPAIFSNVNGSSLGDTAQSIEMHEDIAIIVVNVSNKIEIVNRYTFESLATISSNLSNPRYAEVIGDNIYVSNWGDGMNPGDDFISVFKLSDYSFNQSIPVAEGPEKMIELNDDLYVAHIGGFSFNNIVSHIETETNSVTNEIEVGDRPNSMVIQGNDIWVLSSGKPSYADEETAGVLSRIDAGTDEVVADFQFPENSIHPENLNIAGGSAYLTIEKSLYKYDFNGELPDTPEYSFDEVSVLYGFEINDSKIYIASPRADFTGDGDLYIYDLNDGSLLDNYAVGINPNGVYFN